MILAAAGAVDHDQIVRLAEELFGHCPEARERRGPRPRASRAASSAPEEALEQAHFALAFETPGYRDPDVYTSQIFATALGGGMSSRLFQEAREVRGLCYTIFAQAGAFADSGMTTIYAGTSAAQIAELAG
jgi:predicted Zn-dependent peptidase